jgi:hypothetical protein
MKSGDIPGQQWVRFAELETAPVYDMERMKKALAGPFVTVPDHIKTPEEFEVFLNGAAAAAAALGRGDGG